jgi:broad-specificity NMP kinase
VNGRRPGVVVELLGAPGSGKTRLASALGELPGVAVVKDHQRGDLSTLAWSLARSWPVAVTPPEHVDRVRWAAWAGRVTAASHIARSRLDGGARAVVFDQGAAYTLMRMTQLRTRHHGSVWWWSRALETARLLDLVLVLDADTETLAHRLGERRKDHHADAMPAERLRAYLDTERRACHAVADVLAREGAEARRIVTTESSIDDEVAFVRRWVETRRAVSAEPAS